MTQKPKIICEISQIYSKKKVNTEEFLWFIKPYFVAGLQHIKADITERSLLLTGYGDTMNDGQRPCPQRTPVYGEVRHIVTKKIISAGRLGSNCNENGKKRVHNSALGRVVRKGKD